VSLAFSSSVPFTTVVARALSAFRESYPAVRLNLAEMTRGGQIAALAAGEIDMGFIRGFDPPMNPSLPAGSMVSTMLMKEPLVVAMRSDHRLANRPQAPTIGDLEGEPFVLYQREFGAGFNEHLERLCARAGFAPHVVQEAMGVSTLLGLVVAGMGLTIITRSLGVLHPENVVFRPLDDPEALSSLWLIRRPRLSTAAERFVDLITASVEGETLVGGAMVPPDAELRGRSPQQRLARAENRPAGRSGQLI